MIQAWIRGHLFNVTFAEDPNTGDLSAPSALSAEPLPFPLIFKRSDRALCDEELYGLTAGERRALLDAAYETIAARTEPYGLNRLPEPPVYPPMPPRCEHGTFARCDGCIAEQRKAEYRDARRVWKRGDNS